KTFTIGVLANRYTLVRWRAGWFGWIATSGLLAPPRNDKGGEVPGVVVVRGPVFGRIPPRCPCKPQRGAGCPALSSRSERSVLPFSFAVPGTRFLH
ncbi:MAG: hypothetical protein O3B25_09475, partial [Verrucomicrobia bacterium]|nr:hypothetical protein [Verrucomicrobiota bacterium]